MSIHGARFIMLLLVNLFVSFLGGRLLANVGGWEVLTTGFFVVTLFTVLIGHLGRAPIESFLQKYLSSESRYSGWIAYGVLLFFNMMYMIYTFNKGIPDPSVPFLSLFGVHLLFTLLLFDSKGVWRFLLHTGMIVFLSFLFFDSGRYLTALVYVVLLVYTGTINHYIDRLEQARYKLSVRALEPLLLGTILSFLVIAPGIGYMKLFPNQTEPLAHRGETRYESHRSLFPYPILPVREGSRQQTGSNDQPLFIKILLLTGISLATFLTGILFLNLLLSSMQEQEAASGEQEGQGQAVRLQSITPLAGSFTWSPDRGSVRERIIRSYVSFLDSLSHLGYDREDHETPREFMQRLRNTVPEQGFAVKRITEMFENARYNRITFSEDLLSSFQEKVNTVLDSIRNSND